MRAHQHERVAHGGLVIGAIDRGPLLGPQPALLGIGNYPNDAIPTWTRVANNGTELLADWIPIRPKTLGQRSADYRNRGTVLIVPISEAAPA